MDLIAKFLAAQKVDAATKFKILDMIDERPLEIIDLIDTASNKFDPLNIKDLLSGKTEFYIWDDFVDPKILLEARLESQQIHSEGSMLEAGFGKSSEL